MLYWTLKNRYLLWPFSDEVACRRRSQLVVYLCLSTDVYAQIISCRSGIRVNQLMARHASQWLVPRASSASASAFIRAEIKTDAFPVMTAWRAGQHATYTTASVRLWNNRPLLTHYLTEILNTQFWEINEGSRILYTGPDTSMWNLK